MNMLDALAAGPLSVEQLGDHKKIWALIDSGYATIKPDFMIEATHDRLILILKAAGGRLVSRDACRIWRLMGGDAVGFYRAIERLEGRVTYNMHRLELT